jgi:hypothetical protein
MLMGGKSNGEEPAWQGLDQRTVEEMEIEKRLLRAKSQA